MDTGVDPRAAKTSPPTGVAMKITPAIKNKTSSHAAFL